MTKSEDYFRSFARQMKEHFERIRATHKDSDVKGSRNERIVADFLKEHFSARFIPTNVEIIDSFGGASQEVDVCVCNIDQPFSCGEMVIAEGVDFVIQVKAALNSSEIDRTVRNCSSVKNLKRKVSANDVVHGSKHEKPHYVDRIPYFVFAFSSDTSLKTIRQNLIAKLQTIPTEHQPDGVLILDVGCVFNLRDGQGKGSELHGLVDGKPLGRAVGFLAIESGAESLAQFIYRIHNVTPRFYRAVSALTHYFSGYWDGRVYAETDRGVIIEPERSK